MITCAGIGRPAVKLSSNNFSQFKCVGLWSDEQTLLLCWAMNSGCFQRHSFIWLFVYLHCGKNMVSGTRWPEYSFLPHPFQALIFSYKNWEKEEQRPHRVFVKISWANLGSTENSVWRIARFQSVCLLLVFSLILAQCCVCACVCVCVF